MSLSRPRLPSLSPIWPSELLELILNQLLGQYAEYRSTDLGWQGPVIGSDYWKLAQTAFQFAHCCKGMKAIRAGLPADTLDILARDSAGTHHWHRVARMIAELDAACKNAPVPFSVQPEPVRDYVLYRMDRVGDIMPFLEDEFYPEDIKHGLQYAGALGADGDTWHGDADSHILALENRLEENKKE